MKKVKYIEHISTEPKRDMVLYRLGYRKNKTILNEAQNDVLQKTINEGILLCNLSVAFLRVKILEHTGEYIKLENDIFLQSKTFAKYLKDVDEVLLMASTVGNEVMEEISKSLKRGDASRALILDSVASQTADAGLDWLKEFVDKMLIKENRKMAENRYSPGYGDLGLENQKILFQMLELGKMGLYLTEKYILVPEKSVIAISGIERIE